LLQLTIGGGQLPRVIADWSHETAILDYDLKQIGYSYDAQSDKWSMSDQGADFIYLGDEALFFMLPSGLRGILNAAAWEQAADKSAWITPYGKAIRL
jgi:(E)-4-hydroxy-3-methylbut-2-enyl-diphosphate synthase